MSKVVRQNARRRTDTKERIALRIPAGLTLSGVVLELLIYLLLLAATAGVKPATAQSASSTPGVMLQSGIEKEDVDGDLKGAMSIYDKIAADASAPRDVRARALLRLAGCDEKLGKQAKQVYEQIVRDYSDEPAAAQARTRLATIRQQERPAAPETMAVRKIDREKLGYFSSSDTDGHRVAYIGTDGNLYFGDTSGHTKSLVYRSADPESRRSLGWVPSRDFSIVALALPKTETRPVTLAVVKMDGTGYRELLHDDEQGNILGGNNSFRFAWSWDDRSVLVRPNSKGGCAGLWLVSLADGKRRELVPEESTKCIVRAAFSPDGQFVAYEVWHLYPVPQGATSKVFIVPMRGGAPRLVYESDPWPTNRDQFETTLGDWTADDRYLAVKGVHGGSHALFLLPIKDGVANGSPIFLRAGEFHNAWSTSSGALVFEDESTTGTSQSWHLASIDPDGKIGKWAQIELNRRPIDAAPSFSSHASQFAYSARSLHSMGSDLVIKDLATGQERVVYQSDADRLACQYSTSHPIVFCTSWTFHGKTNLVSVSVDSGAVEQIATFPDSRYLLQSPQEDKVFYFAIDSDQDKDSELSPKIRWDRSTQKEVAVANAAEMGDHEWVVSSDGRWLLRQLNEDLSFRPTTGGDWKNLASGVESRWMSGSTPDGNWAVYVASDPQGHPGIYEAPFSKGEARRVGDLPILRAFKNYDFIFSPDGGKLLATAYFWPENDLWILEDFEPRTAK